MRHTVLGRTLAGLGAVFLLHAATLAAPAPTPATNTIPDTLRPWSGWVERDNLDRVCPSSFNNGEDRRCYWPAALELALDKRGGSFSQHLEVYRELHIALPGDAEHWPQDVKVDGKPAAVSAGDDGMPAVSLGAGAHSLSGSFLWDDLPESLQVPAQTGLITLRLNGQTVAQPKMEKDGHLWLQAHEGGEGGEDGADALELHVSRLVNDTIPLEVTTRLAFSVAGKNRESVFPTVVLPGYTPTAITSDLPARLEADGRLHIQLRPGQWTVTVSARKMGPQQSVTLPAPAANTPALADQEVWVFLGHNELRVAIPSGGTPVDGKLVSLPPEWAALPAFQMKPGESMTLAQSKRGAPEAAPDKLGLERAIWLDFDGKGYSVRDTIAGEFHRNWRLALQAPAELGHVAIDGVDQFITLEDKLSGIEVRNSRARIVAESRISGDTRVLPASGWREDFQSVQIALNLPAGWRLLAASGVDRAAGSWASRWSLLDCFVVLVAAFSFGRLWGRRWGVLAAVTLVLAYHESGAPRWVWLAALAGAGLLSVLPEQAKLRRVAAWYRAAAILVLILITVPFALQQLRQAIYPVLDVQNMVDDWDFAHREMPADAPMQAMAPAPALAPVPTPVLRERPEEMEAGKMEADQSALAKPELRRLSPPPPPKASFSSTQAKIGNPYGEDELERFDPNAIVQTGPGMPSWNNHSYSLEWHGPVDQDQQLHLWLIPPAVNSLLDVLRVLLIGVLIARLLNVPLRWPPSFGRPGSGASTSGAATLVALVLFGTVLATLVPTNAQAQSIPGKDLLDELKQHLDKPATCLPACADIARMQIDAQGESLQLRLEVHTQQDVAVPLPGGATRWVLQSVLADGKPATGLARDGDGMLWIALDAGVHQVVMQGAVGHSENVQLSLPLKPHHVAATAGGWTVAGIRENGLADDNLQLTRVATSGTKALQDNVLPSFVRVERTLQLGLQWRMHTRVLRVVPKEGPIVVAVPLLPGESISAAEPRVEKGVAQVSLGPESQVLEWDSSLAPAGEIVLHASTQDSLIEQWVLDAGPMWHVEPSGIAPVRHENPDGRWEPAWQPWPGEEVKLKVGKPQGAPGQSLTLDQSNYVIEPGLRSSEAKLSLNLRSSRGGLHTITLPEGAILRRVSVNRSTENSELALRLEGRKLSLPLQPGSQSVTIEWRQPGGISTWFTAPPVDLGLPGANATVNIDLPRDRWPLALGGPRVGPALLIWGIIATMALVAWGLARTAIAPLAWRHWFLLGIGLTQISVTGAAIIVLWLLALGVRKSRGEQAGHGLFNLGQIALACWTLVALCLLFGAVKSSLIGYPDMQVQGNFDAGTGFRWYQDRHDANLPQPWVLSLPLVIYRGLMLLWALWLAYSLLKWLRWGWDAYTTGGYWREVWPKKVMEAGPAGAEPVQEEHKAEAPAEPRLEDGPPASP